jgi:hypothetical protein
MGLSRRHRESDIGAVSTKLRDRLVRPKSTGSDLCDA